MGNLRGGLRPRRTEHGYCPSIRRISHILAIAFVAYVFVGCVLTRNGKCIFRSSPPSPSRVYRPGEAEKIRMQNLVGARKVVPVAADQIIEEHRDQHAEEIKPPQALQPAIDDVDRRRAAADLSNNEHQSHVTNSGSSKQGELYAFHKAGDAGIHFSKEGHETLTKPAPVSSDKGLGGAVDKGKPDVGKSAAEHKQDKPDVVDIRLVRDVQEGRSKKLPADSDELQGDPRGDSKDPLPGQTRSHIIVAGDESDAGAAHPQEDDKKEGKKDETAVQPPEHHQHIAEEDKGDTHKWHYVGADGNHPDDKRVLPTIAGQADRIDFVRKVQYLKPVQISCDEAEKIIENNTCEDSCLKTVCCTCTSLIEQIPVLGFTA